MGLRQSQILLFKISILSLYVFYEPLVSCISVKNGLIYFICLYVYMCILLCISTSDLNKLLFESSQNKNKAISADGLIN